MIPRIRTSSVESENKLAHRRSYCLARGPGALLSLELIYSRDGDIAREAASTTAVLKRVKQEEHSLTDVAFHSKAKGNGSSILIGCTRSHNRAACILTVDNQQPDHYFILKIGDARMRSTTNVKRSVITLLNHTLIAL
jgi:hypothetical protein